MRLLLWLSLVLAVLYGGYWVVGSRAVKAGAETALADLRAQGVAEYSEVALHGFPSRFDLTVRDVGLTGAGGALRWQAPFLQVFALAYRPHHVIAVWPQEQSLTLAGEPVALQSQDMRASAVVEPGTALTLDHAAFVARAVALQGSAGRSAEIADLRLAIRKAQDGEPLAQDIGVEVLGVTPSPALKALADPSASLPATIDWLRLDATAGLDRPLDRFAGAGEGPRLTGLELREFNLRWGDLSVEAEGGFEVTATGQPEGRITLRADRWREILHLATTAGLMREEIAPTVENALARLAEASGSPETLELPLVFQRGRMSLGPIPLGAAPRF